MGLNTCAIELELESGFSQTGDRLIHVFGGLRQHRLHRPEQLDGKAGEPGFARRQHRLCYRHNVAGHHNRSPHTLRRKAGGFRDGFHHQRLERSLT